MGLAHARLDGASVLVWDFLSSNGRKKVGHFFGGGDRFLSGKRRDQRSNLYVWAILDSGPLTHHSSLVGWS